MSSPADWAETTIGQQATLQRGIDITRADQRPGDVPVVSSGGTASWHDTAAVSGPGVLLGRKGVVGSVWYIERDYWPHDTTLWVKDFHGNHPRFVYYFFRAIAPRIARMDVGSANPTLNRNHVHPMEVRWPPLAEQRAIAHVLGTLDDKIELNRRMNETLEQMARALFKSWFIDFDPVRAKVDGRWKRGQSLPGLPKGLYDLFPDRLVPSELGEIPEGWEFNSLGELVDLQRGKTYKSGLKDEPGPVLLGLGSIERNGGFRDDKLRTYGGDSPANLIVVPGDLFASLKDVTQSADLLGAVALVPNHIKHGRLTQDTVKLIFKSPKSSRHIVYRTLLTGEYRNYCRSHATGTTNLGLSRDDFLAYPIVRPSSAIQQLFDTLLVRIQSIQANNTSQCRTLAEIRDTVLPRLISGELRVGEAEEIARVAS